MKRAIYITVIAALATSLAMIIVIIAADYVKEKLQEKKEGK